MTLFQGEANNFWQAVVWIAALMMSVAVWYMVIVGRDRPPSRQRRGESTIVNYGDIEEDHAPIPKFLIYTFAGTIFWGLGYLLWTGINGVTGYR